MQTLASLFFAKAILLAEFSVKNKHVQSSKDVKDFGLPSAISNQILRKYGRNKKAKRVNKKKAVKLIVPGQQIEMNDGVVSICFKKHNIDISFSNQSHREIAKINSIELDETYAFVSFEVVDQTLIPVDNWLGVDLNMTGHVAVVANPATGKVMKLGKAIPHLRKKCKALRKTCQVKKQYKKLKKIKSKESRSVKDAEHKIANAIVDAAAAASSGIKLEDLTGIRKCKRNNKETRGTLNTWSFYQLAQLIMYKAHLRGIPVAHVDPAYTSQNCSRCPQLGIRDGKRFACAACGHTDHADSNAAFNIAKTPIGIRSSSPRQSSAKLGPLATQGGNSGTTTSCVVP